MPPPEPEPETEGGDPRIGAVLGGRYRLLRVLGAGAMGVVYEAVQDDLGRHVAVKCLRPNLGQSEEFVARFLVEARVASRLTHPNVVRVYDFGTEQTSDGPLLFLVMELCAGESMGEHLARGEEFRLPRIGAIMDQLLSALGEAHDHGIVHRDVKPDNVLLEPRARGGEVAKLIDFGIAEARTAGLRVEAGLAGTPQYLSPEVIRGDEADHQADLYAAGALLFELLTGESLFDGESVQEILEKQLAAPRPDPRVVAPGRAIPDAVAEVCLRSVALDSAARFADADAFADALAAAIGASLPGAAASVPPRPPLSSHPRVAYRTPPPESSRAPAPASVPVPPASAVPRRADTEPSGRYSLRPSAAAPAAEPPRRPSSGTLFRELQSLETEAAAAMAGRTWGAAIQLLRAGCRQAQGLIDRGETELGQVILTSFGRRLGEALRRSGAPREAVRVLSEVVPQAPRGELSRALLLEELGLAAMACERVGEAVGAWLDAVEDARAAGNEAVERRLLRRIES